MAGACHHGRCCGVLRTIYHRHLLDNIGQQVLAHEGRRPLQDLNIQLYNNKIVDKRNLAFDKTNFIILAVGMLVVILGFILMSGAGSDETVFDNDIFSVRRIKVAPVVCFIGFISIIYAIIRKPKDKVE